MLQPQVLSNVTAERIIRGCNTVVGVHNYTPSDLAAAATFVIDAYKKCPAGFAALGLGLASSEGEGEKVDGGGCRRFALERLEEAFSASIALKGRVLVVP